MSQTTSKAARSIIYLCCIGGLLVLNSLLIVFVWNSLRSSDSSQPELSFLEGAGLSAFLYVIVFAVRYGVQSNTTLFASRKQQPDCSPSPQQRARLAKMTDAQRTALRQELINSCGCTETKTSSQS